VLNHVHTLNRYSTLQHLIANGVLCLKKLSLEIDVHLIHVITQLASQSTMVDAKLVTYAQSLIQINREHVKPLVSISLHQKHVMEMER